MKKFEDIDLVNYIVNNNATLKEAAEFFEVSIDTIKARMRNIKNSLDNDSIILNNLNEVANKNVLEGRKKGGQSSNSGVVRDIELEQIAERAMIMLADNLSIDSAAIRFNIAPSTLYDHLELLNNDEYSELYDDLKAMYSYHNKTKTSGTVIDIEERKFDSDATWLASLKSERYSGIEKLQIKYTEKLEELKRHKNSL